MTSTRTRVYVAGQDMFHERPRPAMPQDTSAPLPQMDGMRYLRMLNRMHRFLKPNWYLEVGTFSGRSLSRANCNFVAVDPQFQFKAPLSHPNATDMFLFQRTSDDFFGSAFCESNGIEFDLAFLDGLHHYEVLLRDFRNTEKLMSPSGVITLHDCCPLNAEMTSRQQGAGAWTGDVWKTLLILVRHRPDLTIQVARAAPTGLAVVSNLNPGDTTLDDRYDALLTEYDHIDLEDLDGGLHGYYGEIPLTDPETALATIGAAPE